MRRSAIFRRPALPFSFFAPWLMAVLCTVLPGAAALHAEQARAPNVAVVVSRDIRPYIEAVEGLSAALSEGVSARVRVFPLERFSGKSAEMLVRDLSAEQFDLFVAVGPEALRFASQNPVPKQIPWIHAMILTPPRVSGWTEGACGVALDIPPYRQLEGIKQGLPAVRRLGLLYNPAYNAEFFLRAQAEAPSLGVRVVPLRVSAKKEIPAVLKQNWDNIDALWLIPDQTVISESIIQYIVKEALFKKTPLIGYNRFFYESGAALAFVFDYEELGRQAGRLAAGVLRGKACVTETPVFRVWLNLRVITRLGMTPPDPKSPLIEAGP